MKRRRIIEISKALFQYAENISQNDIKLNILIFLISVSAVFTFISLFCALNSGNAPYHNMMDRSGYIFDGIMPEDSPEFFRENLPEVYTAYADNAVVSYRSTENYICTESAKVAFNKR